MLVTVAGHLVERGGMGGLAGSKSESESESESFWEVGKQQE